MNARVVFTLAAVLLAGPSFAQTKGRLNLPEFAALADKASETVTVTMDSNLLGFAARFLSSEDPEQAKAKKLVSSLSGVYVQHFTFETDYAYPKGDIDRVRKQGWSVVVQGAAYEVSPNDWPASALQPHEIYLEPWVAGAKLHWIRLIPRLISGRRIRRITETEANPFWLLSTLALTSREAAPR